MSASLSSSSVVESLIDDGHADADRRKDHPAAQRDLVGHHPDDPLGEPQRQVPVGVLEEDGELVAAEAGDGVPFPCAAPEPGGNHLEQLVALVVTEESLMVLKSSRSQNSRQTHEPLLAASSNACAVRSRSSAPLATPVSESWNAWWHELHLERPCPRSRHARPRPVRPSVSGEGEPWASTWRELLPSPRGRSISTTTESSPSADPASPARHDASASGGQELGDRRRHRSPLRRRAEHPKGGLMTVRSSWPETTVMMSREPSTSPSERRSISGVVSLGFHAIASTEHHPQSSRPTADPIPMDNAQVSVARRRSAAASCLSCLSCHFLGAATVSRRTADRRLPRRSPSPSCGPRPPARRTRRARPGGRR